MEENMEEHYFQRSIDRLTQEIESALPRFGTERTHIRRLFLDWNNARNEVILSIMQLVNDLKTNNKANNVVQLGSSVVSAVGGVGFLLAAGVATVPLMAFGLFVSAAGGVTSVASSLTKHFSDTSKIEKTEKLIESDAQKLKELLNAVKEYLDRVQVLKRKIKKLEDELKASKFLSFCLNLGSGALRRHTFLKTFNQIKCLLFNIEKPLSFYEKSIQAIKASAIYRLFFKSSQEVAKNVGGKVAMTTGRKLFALAGIGLDIMVILKSGKELLTEEAPQVVKDFEKLLNDLIEEKIAISISFQDHLTI